MNTLVAPSRLALYLHLIRWDRPAGSYLLLWPTLAALWIAAGGFPGWHLLAVFVLGTILMRSAGCCINDVADIDFDRHVKRTAQRPVTRGAVSVREALLLGAMLALLAFLLVLTTNPPTIALSFAGLAITLAYPYAKRVVSMPQAVLGVAFSFGMPMAFAAALGGGDWNFGAIAAAVPWQAWALMAAWTWTLSRGHLPTVAGLLSLYALAPNLLASAALVTTDIAATLAYDTEYAMVDRDDDLRIGMKTSAITLGRFDVAAEMAFYALHLAGWALLGRGFFGLGAMFLLGIAAAAAQAGWHYMLIRGRGRDGCFKAFRLNHWLGFTVFAGVALDLALR